MSGLENIKKVGRIMSELEDATGLEWDANQGAHAWKLRTPIELGGFGDTWKRGVTWWLEISMSGPNWSGSATVKRRGDVIYERPTGKLEEADDIPKLARRVIADLSSQLSNADRVLTHQIGGDDE